MEQREFEAAIERLKKIKELADRGIEGEAAAAHEKLQQGLKRFGLTLADLQGIKRTEQQIGYDNEYEADIITQVVASMQLQAYKRNRNGRWLKKVFVECTLTELAELRLRLEFYLIVFRKELADITLAYIYKHELFRPNIEPTSGDMDLERAKKLHTLMRGLSDESYSPPLTRIGKEGENNG